AAPVHLGDDLLTELAPPIVLGLAVAEALTRRGGLREVVVAAVRERDVTRAEAVVLLEQREARADDEAVHEADRGDELALPVDALDVVRGVRDLDLVRVHPGHAVDRAELRER